MSDNVFIDTNILVYAHTDLDTVKQLTAQKLVENTNSFISTQVLQELANILYRKFKHPWSDIINVLLEATINNNIHINSSNTVFQACNIANRYGFSFYDSMIIAAALESKCVILYSEDLHDGQLIEKNLIIKNPFS